MYEILKAHHIIHRRIIIIIIHAVREAVNHRAYILRELTKGLVHNSVVVDIQFRYTFAISQGRSCIINY